MLKIELVYVPLNQQAFHCHLELPEGATVKEALLASNLYATYPETQTCLLGIYAKRVHLETVLKEGDRIEVYRALSLDPKEKRRQKAKKNAL